MIDQQTRVTKLPAHLLPPRIIEGLEARVTDEGGMKRPRIDSHLKESIELRAIARDLIKHINAREGIGQEVAGQ